jgi:hypothetical protein
MNNSIDRVYDLAPIKLPVWTIMGEYMIKYITEGDHGFSIFSVHSIATQEIFRFEINQTLGILNNEIDESENLEVTDPEKFRIIELLILNYIRNKC